jgi:hypothetical protein
MSWQRATSFSGDRSGCGCQSRDTGASELCIQNADCRDAGQPAAGTLGPAVVLKAFRQSRADT